MRIISAAVLAFIAVRVVGGGERLVVVAFGDSTTAPWPGHAVYGDILGERLRAEGLRVDVLNLGVRGDTTHRAAERFEQDVLTHRPQLVIIQFGINDATIDVWKNPPETLPRVPREQFGRNLRSFVAQCRERGIHVVLVTPNPLSWTTRLRELYGRPPYALEDPDGLNLNLRLYAETMREVARASQTPLVDVMRAHDESAKREPGSLTHDGIHPNAAGHQLVADLLMELLKTRPDWLIPSVTVR